MGSNKTSKESGGGTRHCFVTISLYFPNRGGHADTTGDRECLEELERFAGQVEKMLRHPGGWSA
jgi:hypothetical protein